MWILHEDETHYDLMVNKESDLAKDGTIEDLANHDDKKDEKVTTRKEHGPGYMGWEASDELENESDETDLKKTVVELIESNSEIKKEVSKMKQEMIKRDKKQETELKMLKEEFQKCLEKLKAETYARTKAETLAKVLQDTLDAKNELEKLDNTQEMEVDVTGDEKEEGDGKWEKQRSEKRREKKRNRNSVVYCKECRKTFANKASLKEHMVEHEKQTQDHVGFDSGKHKENSVNVNDMKVHTKNHEESKFTCDECSVTFTAKNELDEHVKNHTQNNSNQCNKCGQCLQSNEDLRRHLISHTKQSSIIQPPFNKCDTKYSDMRKLRRHDWRMHSTGQLSARYVWKY